MKRLLEKPGIERQPQQALFAAKGDTRRQIEHHDCLRRRGIVFEGVDTTTLLHHDQPVLSGHPGQEKTGTE